MLVLVRGMTLLNDVPICLVRKPLTFNQDVKAIVPRQGIDSRFLAYSVLARKRDLLAAVELAGHGTGKLPTDRLSDLGIWLPSLPQQRAIAAVLGALDDKIDLNRRMIETLEETARALFKSWFVDFDPVRAKADGRQPFGMDSQTAGTFSAAFENSELGEVPVGWSVEQLSRFITLDKGVSYKGDYLTNTGAPMINLGCFGGDGRFFPERIKGYAGEVRAQHWVREDDLVLANTDMTQNRVILGSPALVPPIEGHQRALISHHVFAVRQVEDDPTLRLYLYFTLLQPEFRRRAAGFATGTTVLALPRDAVLSLLCVVPPPAVRTAFSNVVRPLRSRIQAAIAESKQVVELRDYLLPKLLSGEVRVRDAEKLAGAAA